MERPDKRVLKRAVDSAGSFAGAARGLGVPVSTLKGWCADLGIPSSMSAQPMVRGEVVEIKRDPEEYARLRRKVVRLEGAKQQLEQEVSVQAQRAEWMSEIHALVEPYLEDLTLDAPDPPVVELGENPVSAVLHVCDWHLGEVVRPETIDGQNEYDVQLACDRWSYVVEKVQRILETYADSGVAEIVLVVNGDLASGQHNLHPESADETSWIVKQVLDAALLLGYGVRDLAGIVPRVRVVCTGDDNHMRSTKKPPTGRASIETSWAQMLYEYAAAITRVIPNVTWEIHRSYRARFDVAGSTFSAMHGHGMSGGGGQLGFPAYGLNRTHQGGVGRGVAAARKSQNPLEALSKIARHTRVGHFHSYMVWQINDGTVAITPSLKGSDAYSIDRLERFSPAGQLLEIMHPEHDLVAQHPIVVQDVCRGSGRYAVGAMSSTEPAAVEYDR